jgi:hypothetical protein
MEVRNIHYNDSVSNNINATIAESEGNVGSLLGQESLAIEEMVETKHAYEGQTHL